MLIRSRIAQRAQKTTSEVFPTRNARRPNFWPKTDLQICDLRRDSGPPNGGDDDGNEGDGHDQDDEGEDDRLRGTKRSLADRLSDAADDDEGPRGPKRSRLNASNFVWRSRAKDFLDSMVFSPEHRDLLRQVDVYSQDPKGTISDLLNTFDAPALPETQWRNVLLDRFVDFDTILASSYTVEPEEPQQLVLGDTHLEVKRADTIAERGQRVHQGQQPDRCCLVREAPAGVEARSQNRRPGTLNPNPFRLCADEAIFPSDAATNRGA
jgi:hypothetical protein